MDNLEETILQPIDGDAEDSSPDSSSAPPVPVALIEGSGPCLLDETTRLLHQRLRGAAFILTVMLTVFFAWNLFRDVRLLAFRTAILGVVAGIYFLLRRCKCLSIRQLRAVEYVLFGVLLVKLVTIQSDMLQHYCTQHCVAGVVAVAHLGFSVISINILLYAMLIPTTWRRAAAILFPVACLPYVVVLVMKGADQAVAEALAADRLGVPVPLPFLTAFAGVYGTYLLSSVRREAFGARQFGQYKLRKHMGSGGMGEVYEAEHLLLKRPCAVKLIREGQHADATALARFEREVRSMAKLSHWNTVEIYDYGRTADGNFYYVMELLKGLSLQQLIDAHGRMTPGRVVYLLRQTCRALKEAHAINLIHRDIKPANIFAAICGGEHDVAKLLDFGLVKDTAQSSTTDDVQLTQMGSFCGSPLYAAPELAMSRGVTDVRCDIYSLGCVAYHLLTGEAPFTGETALAILAAHSRDQVVPPSQTVPDIPRDLEAVVLRCLEKSPDKRFQNAADLEQAFAECQIASHWSESQAAAWWQSHVANIGSAARTGPHAPTETIARTP